MEETPNLSTNEPRRHSYRARFGEDMSNTYSRPVHHLTNDPSPYAIEQPASYYHGTSSDWTQPLTQYASFAVHLSGNHEYLNEDFVHTSEDVPVNSFNIDDSHAPHHSIAATPNRGVLLPQPSLCDSLPGTSAIEEGIYSTRSDVPGVWGDPSFSAVPPFLPAEGRFRTTEGLEDSTLQPDHDTIPSPTPQHVAAAALVRRPIGPIQQRNNASQKIRRKSSLQADGATTKQRAANRQSREEVSSARWETYKPAIRELYLEERKPLKDVIRIMHERHGFQATPKMYKTRFSQWGFAKNNTEDEVKQLLSIKFKRDAEGKVSEFIRNGKVVNLATYLKRKGATEYDLVDFEITSRLPSHVRCRTPSPPPAPGYLRSPDLIRAQEILIGNLRKALIYCQQTESNNLYQHGWTSLLLWGAESSGMLYEAGKLFRKSQNNQAGDLLMRAFQHLEVDLRQLSTQGTKELLFCISISHRNPGMTTALSKYLAAYSTTNYERLHPLRLIFASLYESAMPTLAEEIEAIYGSHSPLAVRTWIDLSMLYNHTNPYRLSNLYTELGYLSHNYGAVQEEYIGFCYARLQLAASIDVTGIAHRAQLVELWNYCVADNIVFGVHGQPEVYCWHPVLQVQPSVSRMLQRYRVTMKHLEVIFNCKMICGFPLEPHPVEHADETDPPDNYRLLKIPISLSDLQPMPSPAAGEGLEDLGA